MLTTTISSGYLERVTANSVADLGGSKPEWRHSAPKTGAFFASVCYGGCAWKPSGAAGVHSGRSANPRTVAPIRCLAASGDDSKPNGVSPMTHSHQSLLDRAAAHRAMAKSQLFKDSSARVRVRRYNEHMEKARHLEATAKRMQEVAQ